MSTKQVVSSLYRRSLKLSLDWSVDRGIWRGQAMYLRSLFEANKDVKDPRAQRAIYQETEDLLEKWKHPDPYIPPTAPGGSKYERNLPAPILDPPPPMHLQEICGLGQVDGSVFVHNDWTSNGTRWLLCYSTFFGDMSHLSLLLVMVTFKDMSFGLRPGSS